MKTRWDTRKITGLALVSAIAYVIMLAGFRFMASAPFLKYEAKDVILTIGGFIYGPAGALAASFGVALLEMITISETGPVGFLMNFIAAASYACPASIYYKRYRTAKGAAIGLAIGSASLTAVMLLWNYVITPLYMNVPRAVVTGMLLPVFLPFNLIKAGLNSAITLLIYKPLTTALRAAKLLPGETPASVPNAVTAHADTASAGVSSADVPSADVTPVRKYKINMGLLIGACVLLILCALAILYYKLQFTG